MLRCRVWGRDRIRGTEGRHQWDQMSSPIHLTNVLLFTCPSRFHNVTQMLFLPDAIQIHSLPGLGIFPMWEKTIHVFDLCHRFSSAFSVKYLIWLCVNSIQFFV